MHRGLWLISFTRLLKCVLLGKNICAFALVFCYIILIFKADLPSLYKLQGDGWDEPSHWRRPKKIASLYRAAQMAAFYFRKQLPSTLLTISYLVNMNVLVSCLN